MARKTAGKTVRKAAGRPKPRKAARKTAARPKARPSVRRGSRTPDPLMAPIPGADRRDVGGVRLEVMRVGAARVKRTLYPAGFRWSKDMKQISGTDLCMHGHVGFLAKGSIHIEYGDGCVEEYTAPRIVRIDPGHDGWVVGPGPAVMIEFDFERDTIKRLGLPDAHRHA